MRLVTLKEDLSKLLGLSTRFVSTRTQIPILENIVLSAKKTRLYTRATNLEISVSASIGAKVEEEGDIAIPGRAIFDIVNNINSETVYLESKKELLQIRTENYSANISGMNISDFPTIPEALDKGAISFPWEVFVKSIQKVLFSVSRDETRPVLTGVLFLFKGDSLFFVSSDGFRLSQKKVSLNHVPKLENLILPRTILTEILKLSENKKNSFSFQVKPLENQIVFGVGSVVLGSRLIEGDFPDFEKIIPKSPRVKIRVGKEDLFRVIKLASVFARDSANVIKLLIGPDELKISAESPKIGSQEGSLPVKVEGERMEISYNYRFIEEFLEVVEGEDVEIELIDSTSPGIFRDTKDPNFLHLIMPVRLQG